MITQTVTVTEKGSQNIIIGRCGTYDTESVVFDVTYLVDTFGSGTPVLLVKRPNDTVPYPVVTTTEGNLVTWLVDETDTSYKGHGECELFWYVDGGLAKSIIYSIAVLRDIIGQISVEPPDPYQTWVDDLTELGAETLANAQNAANSADDAAYSAGIASGYARGAVEAQEMAVRAEREATAAKEDAIRAKNSAWDAVDAYPKIINLYWWVWLNGQYVNTGIKAQGTDGRGITNFTCVKSSTVGLVDTYTMTVTYTDGNTDTLTFTVTNGFSPTASVSKSGNTATITITDKNGTTTATITDGISPEVAVTPTAGGHEVTITDATHPDGQTFEVLDGEVTNAVLQAALDTKAPVIIDTASGAIASFPDGANGMPMKVVAEINPVQNLNGYDSPWPAGGGNNRFDASTVPDENKYINSNTGATQAPTGDASWRYSDYIPVTPGEVLFFGEVYSTASSAGTAYYDANKDYVSGFNAYSLSNASGVKTVPEGVAYMRHSFLVSETTNPNWQTTVYITLNSNPHEWTPFANECPITGHTGAEIWDDPAHGGLIDFNQLASLSVSDYTIGNASVTVTEKEFTLTPTTNSSTSKLAKKDLTINHAYCILGDFKFSENNDSVGALFGVWKSDTNGTLSIEQNKTTNYISVGLLYKPTVASYFAMRVNNAVTTSMTAYFKNVQLFDLTQMFGAGNEPSTVEEFKSLFPKDFYAYNVGGVETCVSAVNGDPYRHEEIDFPVAAGAVYGAKIQVNEDGTGVLTVTHGEAVYDGSSDEGWVKGTYNNRTVFQSNKPTNSKANYYSGISNYLPMQGGVTDDNTAVFGVTKVNVRFDTIDNATDFADYLEDHPLQFVYELNEPVTYNLTAEQTGGILRSLYGQNNVWNSCNGDTTVQYPADTKLYIQKLTKPTEDDMIANQNIASGTFFMVGNSLYYSTASIANGAAIVPGTNCTALSLADALNNLNS